MEPNLHVKVGAATFGNDLPLALIAGPCQLESREHAFDMAGRLKEMAAGFGIGLVYKTSFDKANRTSLIGKRGLGIDRSLAVFADIRAELGLPVLTDVHEREQCAELAEVVDVLQTTTGEWIFESPRIDTTSTHGTGCTLASAITALLAKGQSVPEAVEQGRDYLMGAIRAAKGFGKGAGPVHHGWVLDDEK